MGVDLDASDCETEDDAHESNRPKPGSYHVEVLAVDDTFEKFDKIIVDFKVLNGTVPGQKGKVQTEFFATTEKALPRLKMFAMAVGLLQPGERKEVEFADALGALLVITVDEKVGQDGKSYVNTVWDGFWSLDNPAVVDVPRGEVEVMELVADASDSVAAETPESNWDDI